MKRLLSVDGAKHGRREGNVTSGLTVTSVKRFVLPAMPKHLSQSSRLVHLTGC